MNDGINGTNISCPDSVMNTIISLFQLSHAWIDCNPRHFTTKDANGDLIPNAKMRVYVILSRPCRQKGVTSLKQSYSNWSKASRHLLMTGTPLSIKWRGYSDPFSRKTGPSSKLWPISKEELLSTTTWQNKGCCIFSQR